MTADELRSTCLALPGAVEERPFRDSNNRHWNTILLDGSLPRDVVEDSYALIVTA